MRHINCQAWMTESDQQYHFTVNFFFILLTRSLSFFDYFNSILFWCDVKYHWRHNWKHTSMRVNRFRICRAHTHTQMHKCKLINEYCSLFKCCDNCQLLYCTCDIWHCLCVFVEAFWIITVKGWHTSGYEYYQNSQKGGLWSKTMYGKKAFNHNECSLWRVYGQQYNSLNTMIIHIFDPIWINNNNYTS